MIDRPDTPAARAGLRTRIATPRTDPTIAWYVDRMRPTDGVLIEQGGAKGLKIYEEIERDPLAHAVLQKRKLALIAREWRVDPGGPRRDDKKAADLARRWLAGDWGLSFDRLCLDLMDATLKGYAVAELVWDVRDGFFVPVAAEAGNQRRFVFGTEGELRVLTRDNSWTGEVAPERKFVVHRFGAVVGDPYGRGLGHQLYWWVFFKRLATQFWMTFAEKFGSPTVVGKVPDTMTEEEEGRLLDKLAGVAQEAAITIPQEASVDFLEAARSGQVTYPELVAYCDKMITIAVLGETLTTTEGVSGSRALGQVHQAVKDEVVDADSDLLSATLNGQVLTWLTEINHPGAAPPRVWRPRPSEEEQDAKTAQEQLKAASAALSHVNEMRRSGWEPEDPAAPLADQALGRWVYTGRVTAAGPDPGAPDSGAADPPALAAPESPAADPRPHDPVAPLVDQLDQAAAGPMDDLVGQVRDLLAQVEAEGGSLADVLPRLTDLVPALDVGDLALVVGRGMALANLAGRLGDG